MQSILGSHVQGELDFCALWAQKDWWVVSATSYSVCTIQWIMNNCGVAQKQIECESWWTTRGYAAALSSPIFLQKSVDNSAALCYTSSYSHSRMNDYAKNWILKIVFGFAINNGRGARLISSAGFLGKRFSCPVRKGALPKHCGCRLACIAGAWENILRTVTSVESYHWFKRSGVSRRIRKTFALECYHESSSESIHGFFVAK